MNLELHESEYVPARNEMFALAEKAIASRSVDGLLEAFHQLEDVLYDEGDFHEDFNEAFGPDFPEVISDDGSDLLYSVSCSEPRIYFSDDYGEGSYSFILITPETCDLYLRGCASGCGEHVFRRGSSEHQFFLGN
jgi:hypothetical protein